MPDYIIPTTAALMEIEQDLRPRLQQDRPVFEIMPTEEVDEWYIAWEQRDMRDLPWPARFDGCCRTTFSTGSAYLISRGSVRSSPGM